MNNRIKILKNFISKQDSNFLIKTMQQLEKNNLLVNFKDNPDVLVVESNKQVDQILKKYSLLLNNIHKKENGFVPKLYTTEGFLSLWNKGASSDVHTDSHKGYEFLQFATIIYLNDDFVGGNIFFPNQNFLYKPKSRDAIIFPCGGTEYLHGVTKIQSGKRYTIAMWHSSYGNFSKELN